MVAKSINAKKLKAIARTIEEKKEILGISLSYTGAEVIVSFTVEACSASSLQGKMIRIARIANGLSQKEFAQKIGINRKTLSRWEITGCSNAIYYLEQCLGVPPQTFLVGC